MNLDIGFRSITGPTRSANQDALLVDPPLFAVLDGVGGGQGGDIAASLAVAALRDATAAIAATPDPTAALSAAIVEAHRRIRSRATDMPDLRGMASTVVAVVACVGARFVVAHVGDSRCYISHQGQLVQVTQDHSVVAELVRSGAIRADEANSHPLRSQITQALGSGDSDVSPTIDLIDVADGDRILLCSDGAWSLLTDAEIAGYLDEPPQEAADRIVQEAVTRGGPDNITAIVITAIDVSGDTATAGLARSSSDDREEVPPL
jgi:protein phosphatase